MTFRPCFVALKKLGCSTTSDIVANGYSTLVGTGTLRLLPEAILLLLAVLHVFTLCNYCLNRGAQVSKSYLDWNLDSVFVDILEDCSSILLHCNNYCPTLHSCGASNRPAQAIQYSCYV